MDALAKELNNFRNQAISNDCAEGQISSVIRMLNTQIPEDLLEAARNGKTEVRSNIRFNDSFYAGVKEALLSHAFNFGDGVQVKVTKIGTTEDFARGPSCSWNNNVRFVYYTASYSVPE